MPLTVNIEPSRDLVVIDGTGTIGLDDFLRLIDDLSKAGMEIRGRNGIIDSSRIASASITFDEVRRISDRVTQVEELFRGTRWAIVAPGDVMFGIARMYESLRHGGSFAIRAFRNAREADAWLQSGGPAL